jgi:hypothetical protein
MIKITKIKNLINHPWIITIAGTAIATIILEYFGILGLYLSVIAGRIISLIITTIPIWVIILALILLFLTKWLYLCIQSRHFLSYKEAKINSILWRWDYRSSSKNEYIISDLKPHCPKCKCELSLDEDEYYSCINPECKKFKDKYGYKKEKNDIIKIIKQKIEKENPHIYKRVKLLVE